MAQKKTRKKASKNLQKDASDEAVTHDEILTTAETATLLRVSPRTLYRFRHEMGMPCLKLGSCVRYRRSEVLEWAYSHGRIDRQDGQE